MTARDSTVQGNKSNEVREHDWTDHWECDFLRNLVKVRVALFDVVLPGSKVWTDKTHRCVVQQEAYCNCSLVACGAAQTGLDAYHCHVPTVTVNHAHHSTGHHHHIRFNGCFQVNQDWPVSLRSISFRCSRKRTSGISGMFLCAIHINQPTMSKHWKKTMIST